MATKVFGNFTHKWELDLPWHMVHLRDWFYMVNVGFIEPVVFLHVRVLGIRSLWEYRASPNLQRSPTPRAAESGDGADDLPLVLKCAKCYHPRMRYGRYLQSCQNCGDEGIDLFEDMGNL